LPVAALLKQYNENHNGLIRHFDLLYIQQGVDRLPVDEGLDLLPTLLHGLSANVEESAKSAASLFNMFLKLLHSMKLPPRGTKEDLDLRAKFGLADRTDDARFVASSLGKLILFGISQQGTNRCPGLSVEDCNFWQLYGKKDTWTPTASGGLSLVETKVVAAKFLASGAFVDSERFLPALFASADPNSRISDIGEDMLKRATSAVSFEDEVLVRQLYDIYLGTRGTEGSLPARPPLRTKILALLCKSKLASSFVSKSIQIIQEGLAPQESLQQDRSTQSSTQNLNHISTQTLRQLSTQTSNQTSKGGLETSKLRGQIFAFANWLARISSPEDISSFAPKLVGQLRSYIGDQGWPPPNTTEQLTSGELSSRAYGYESIGLLAAACPGKLLLEPNMDLLRWLFTSLSEDSSGSDILISIEQALSSILGAFGGELDSELELSLTALLLHYMSLSPGDKTSNGVVVRSTRFVVVRFTNRCLRFGSIAGRWINVLALCSDTTERSGLFEEAKKGLDPYWYRLLNPPKIIASGGDRSYDSGIYSFPTFPDLVERFFGPNTGWNPIRFQNAQIGNAYLLALSFCRCILLHQALSYVKAPPIVDATWDRNIDALVANDEDSRFKLKQFFRSFSKDEGAARALKILLLSCFNGMISQGGGDLSKAGDFLLELCSLLPASMYAELSTRISGLQEPIYSSNKALRITASHLFGLLGSLEEFSRVESSKMMTGFDSQIQSWQEAIGSEVLQVHGALLAIAFYFSRSRGRSTLPPADTERQSMTVDIYFKVLSESRDRLLLHAVFIAISEWALYGVLTLGTVSPSNQEIIMAKLTEKCKDGDEPAITALGNYAMQCEEEGLEDSTLSKIIDRLYELHTVRQAEVQFAVGAALACAAVGWRSKSLIAALDIDMALPKSAVRTQTLSLILERVLVDCKTSKPALRQAVVIWLLCLVQYCGHLPEVQGRLRECQVAFKGFLADRESLNQESASRGLTLVYEKGGKALKDDLIRDLVGSFTGTNTGLAGKVSGDTELFDAGALPTGDGSITTYKDIMSLASEVGDSSLVYRFMSLASNNAIWSSRAAFGRFGLSSILNDASLDGYLAHNPKLYPALYRYRFDPNTNVRNSMNDIWSALVKNSATTISTYFDSIMDELLKNILGKEWRVRQASCAAIADLVQGRPLEKYEKYLTEIWTLTFKVCDDIKESVRTAAMALAQVLTGILTRGLEAGDSSAQNANKMLTQVLPFLLGPSGLESGAPEVQEFSRNTLLQIIKKSNGKTLLPFVPELVGRLLALLSSIEPEMVNYLHLNAEKYGMTAQELDDARLKHIRGSSMLEAIERCLDFLDEESMPELQRHLVNAIKTVIGLPSKVGCSRVLVSLSTRQNFIFKPYADAFMPLARKQVFDRNDTISSSYATACGYMARLASDDSLLKLVEGCRTLYFDSDDDRQRMISGDIVYAVSKHATDRFNSLAGEILPFVFVAKHDTYERAKSLFSDTWNENVGGSRAVLLYLKEIVQHTLHYLDSPRWSLKHTSAFAIADVVTSAGTSISDENAKAIWPALEKALSGKTWEGKEKVLRAFVQFSKNSNLLEKDLTVKRKMEKIIIRESKRNNPSYRQHAIECLGDFINLRDDVNMYDQVYDITKPIIEELARNTEKMDVDSPSGGPSSKAVTELTLAHSLTALLRSIGPPTGGVEVLNTRLSQAYELLTTTNRFESGSKIVQNAMYEALGSLFQNLQKLDQQTLPGSLENTLVEYANQIFASTDQVEHIRLKAAEAAVALASVSRSGDRLREAFADGLANARRQERSTLVQHSLDRALKISKER